MKPRLVALTGVSGVGKSTLLMAVSTRLRFQHLQASALINKGQETAFGQSTAHDRLRFADLDENQQLLVRALEASVDPAARLVVLDSHTLIERSDENFVVAPEVFRAIGICAMVFLQVEPEKLLKRRVNDQLRERPSKNVAALAKVQVEALAQAELICRKMDVPLHLETSSNIEGFVKLLSRLRDGEGH